MLFTSEEVPVYKESFRLLIEQQLSVQPPTMKGHCSRAVRWSRKTMRRVHPRHTARSHFRWKCETAHLVLVHTFLLHASFVFVETKKMPRWISTSKPTFSCLSLLCPTNNLYDIHGQHYHKNSLKVMEFPSKSIKYPEIHGKTYSIIPQQNTIIFQLESRHTAQGAKE